MLLQSGHWQDSVRDWLANLGTGRMRTEGASTLEDIRQAMIDALVRAENLQIRGALRLRTRIGFAPDIQTLWYLRSNLMQVLCASFGEAEATRQMHNISALFNNLPSQGLKPRKPARA